MERHANRPCCTVPGAQGTGPCPTGARLQARVSFATIGEPRKAPPFMPLSASMFFPLLARPARLVPWLAALGMVAGAAQAAGEAPASQAAAAMSFVQARQALLQRSEEHTSELQSPCNLVCRLLLEKKKNPGKHIYVPSMTNATTPTSDYMPALQV